MVSGLLEEIRTKGGLIEEICRAQVRQAARGRVSRVFATKGGVHRKGGPQARPTINYARTSRQEEAKPQKCFVRRSRIIIFRSVGCC